MSNINHLIKKAASNVSRTWNSYLEEDKNLTNWNLAKKISDMLNCKLEVLPEKLWSVETGIDLMGQTDGKIIHVRSMDTIHNLYVFFHEVGHVLFHWNPKRRLTQKEEELEADMFALRVCMNLHPENKSEFIIFSRINAGRKPLIINGILNTHKQVMDENVFEGAHLYYKQGPNFGYCRLTQVIVISKRGRNILVYPQYSPDETFIVSMSELYIQK